MKPVLLQEGRRAILYDADRVPHPAAIPFDHNSAVDPEPVVGAGRGAVWRVRVDGTVAALRQYRRGGLVRRLLRSAYLWTGLERTRAIHEWRLLAELHAEGLPVPAPLAARVTRTGFWYRAELLTEWVPGTRSLVARLADRELPDATWAAVGAALRRFHVAGVWHADLNAHNVLIDDAGRVFVVDFDRGRRRRRDGRWARKNLARLRRSLEKVHATGRALYYTRAGWSALLDGYGRGG